MISERKIIKLIDLARKCNLCAMYHFKNLDRTQVDYKEDLSPLTKADIEVNNIAVEGLKKLFPDIEIVSEESKNSHNSLKNNKVFWLVDPIDGTKEFISKSPNFTVNFALIENNFPVFGLIAQPYTDTVWYNYNDKAWKLEKNYKIDMQEVRKYFPLEVVTNGLLEIYQKILGLKFNIIETKNKWHKDVSLYEVKDKKTKKWQTTV